MDEKFQEIKRYFDELDSISLKNKTHTKNNAAGMYAPISLEHLTLGMDFLVDNSVIDVTSTFCHAGSNDGRVVILSSEVYKIPSIGVQYDGLLATGSRINILILQDPSIVDRYSVEILAGEFTKDKTYNSNDVSFEKIKTFFNHVDNHYAMAEKIARQSPKDTMFILNSSQPSPYVFPGLKLELSLELKDGAQIAIERSSKVIANSENLKPLIDRDFMHIYRN